MTENVCRSNVYDKSRRPVFFSFFPGADRVGILDRENAAHPVERQCIYTHFRSILYASTSIEKLEENSLLGGGRPSSYLYECAELSFFDGAYSIVERLQSVCYKKGRPAAAAAAFLFIQHVYMFTTSIFFSISLVLLS